MFLVFRPRTQIAVCHPFSAQNLASALHHWLVPIGYGIYSRWQFLPRLLLFNSAQIKEHFMKKGQPRTHFSPINLHCCLFNHKLCYDKVQYIKLTRSYAPQEKENQTDAKT
jgi:hypothetical protein